MRVGVISDTHIYDRRRVIPAAVWQAFAGVDCILHAGDIARQDVLDELATLAPVHAVYGNVDPPELASTLKAALVLDLDGVRIGLTHGHLGRGRTTPQCALSLFVGVEDLRAVDHGDSPVPSSAIEM